ncbi:hypothetical protein HNY73_018079 [Argiope bruennichi]|uniref:Uncharacterized protein n=1 Tax=Argiope bruennichi TaxID=94029 RepID=A0A8T0ED46_ARGBR|nr:hypothetical protein HNY73_018079 [Argiope bruennichi]
MPITVDDITKMSHQFAVKWNISVQKLANIAKSKESIVLKSNRYRFKNIKYLEFSYELCYDKFRQTYRMRVDCISDMAIFLENVLVLVGSRVYRVQGSSTNTTGRLIFDQNVLRNNSFKDDKVTFHCIMSIPAEVKAEIQIPDGLVNDVECESIMTCRNIYPHGYDAVTKFEYSSRIPDFNVEMASNLISEAHQRHNLILKALCSEYLMENLTSENVVEVLKQAIAADAKDLLQKCGDFIAEKCKIVSIH